MNTIRERVYSRTYRIAKCVYKILPIPVKIKSKLAVKIINILTLIHVSSYDNYYSLGYNHIIDRGASIHLQNILFPTAAECAERVMIVLVPFLNTMSGGIYSLFSIATYAKQLKSRHGWEVLVMTVPNVLKLTYLRNRHFTNNVDVFRFSQIFRLKKSKEIYIHIPEYASSSFLRDISKKEKEFLISRQALHINIMNQNIKLMPTPEKIDLLKKNFKSVGQSVAHHAYFGQDFVLKYKIDSLLLPAFTDLSNYIPLPFEKKEKLIIYSPDNSPYKRECLSLLRSSFPDFEFIEIFDITFEKYMEYASKCFFSISFGEGFDGYLAQPIYQGGIGFAVYNEDFFPSSEFLSFYNIFESEKIMLKELPIRIRKLLDEPVRYKSLNSKLLAIYNDLYNKDEYIDRIERLCEMRYDLRYRDASP